MSALSAPTKLGTRPDRPDRVVYAVGGSMKTPLITALGPASLLIVITNFPDTFH